VTELTRMALLAVAKEWQFESAAGGWGYTPTPLDRKVQALIQALEVENQRRVVVKRPKLSKRGDK
jgi:hypothetical protein